MKRKTGNYMIIFGLIMAGVLSFVSFNKAKIKAMISAHHLEKIHNK